MEEAQEINPVEEFRKRYNQATQMYRKADVLAHKAEACKFEAQKQEAALKSDLALYLITKNAPGGYGLDLFNTGLIKPVSECMLSPERK